MKFLMISLGLICTMAGVGMIENDESLLEGAAIALCGLVMMFTGVSAIAKDDDMWRDRS